MRARIGLIAGPLAFAAMLLAAPPGGMTVLAWRAAAGDFLFVSPGELARFGRTYAHIPPLPPEWQGRGPFLVTP
jgi:hypothetical protein